VSESFQWRPRLNIGTGGVLNERGRYRGKILQLLCSKACPVFLDVTKAIDNRIKKRLYGSEGVRVKKMAELEVADNGERVNKTESTRIISGRYYASR